MKPKSSRKTLRYKVDMLAAKYIRSIGRCEAAGHGPVTCGPKLECCHLKSRGNMTIRHDPLNMICMCSSHHRWFTMHPDFWHKFIEEAFPGRWDRLNALLMEGGRPDYDFWQDYFTRNPERAA